MLHQNKVSLFLIGVVFITIQLTFSEVAQAQFELATGMSFRSMKPGLGFNLGGELGIPVSEDWRIGIRANLGIFGKADPDYRDIRKIDWNRGDTTYVKPYAGLKMSSFDRTIGARIYYQATEFQPYFGLGMTYAYNDIDEPPGQTNYDNMDRALNFDFHFGFKYLMSDHWNMNMDLQFTNITRANYIKNENFFGFNIGVSYRFGVDKFSNVYE